MLANPLKPKKKIIKVYIFKLFVYINYEFICFRPFLHKLLTSQVLKTLCIFIRFLDIYVS